MASGLGETLRELARNFTPEAAVKVATEESQKLVHRVEQWAHMSEWEPVSQRVWDHQPSLVAAEGLFAFLFLVCLLHALRRGRVFFLVFWSSLLVGLLHELAALVLLPEVGTFYRAHALVMVGPSTPLFTFFVYTSLVYCAVVSGFTLQLGLFGNSAAVGLLGGLFYSVYDLVGTKMLWWTWHEGDQMVSERVLGVPVLSTMWAMVLCSTFFFLLYLFISRSRSVPVLLLLFTSVVLVVFTLPLVLASGLLIPYVSDTFGRPDVSCLLALLCAYIFVMSLCMNATARWMGKRLQPTLMDGFLSTAINLYLAGMTFIAFFFNPPTQLSYGLRQAIGACDATENDLLGTARPKYLCEERFPAHFVQEDASGGEWYSVRGMPIPERQVWVLLVVLLSLVSMMLYTYLLTAPLPRVVPSALPANSTSSAKPAAQNKANAKGTKGAKSKAQPAKQKK